MTPGQGLPADAPVELWPASPRRAGHANPENLFTGEAGIEPANGGSRGRCLTTWLLPNVLIYSDHLPACRSFLTAEALAKVVSKGRATPQ